MRVRFLSLYHISVCNTGFALYSYICYLTQSLDVIKLSTLIWSDLWCFSGSGHHPPRAPSDVTQTSLRLCLSDSHSSTTSLGSLGSLGSTNQEDLAVRGLRWTPVRLLESLLVTRIFVRKIRTVIQRGSGGGSRPGSCLSSQYSRDARKPSVRANSLGKSMFLLSNKLTGWFSLKYTMEN